MLIAGLCAVAGSTQSVAASRTLHLYNTHTHETLKVTFKRNGRFVPSALRELNRFLRDWRRNEIVKMDPNLFDLLWTVYRQSRARKPIHVVSGYRSPATNNMLRRRSRGVAKFSQHTRGRAIDFHLPGVPMSRVRAAGLRMEVGGVGYYPSARKPFVHLDTGSVRHWPRMSRKQLSRVFPRGRTIHVPRDGKPLRGYKEALARHKRRKSGRTVVATYERPNSANGDLNEHRIIRTPGEGGSSMRAAFAGGNSGKPERARAAKPERVTARRASARVAVTKPVQTAKPASKPASKPSKPTATAKAAKTPPGVKAPVPPAEIATKPVTETVVAPPTPRQRPKSLEKKPAPTPSEIVMARATLPEPAKSAASEQAALAAATAEMRKTVSDDAAPKDTVAEAGIKAADTVAGSTEPAISETAQKPAERPASPEPGTMKVPEPGTMMVAAKPGSIDAANAGSPPAVPQSRSFQTASLTTETGEPAESATALSGIPIPKRRPAYMTAAADNPFALHNLPAPRPETLMAYASPSTATDEALMTARPAQVLPASARRPAAPVKKAASRSPVQSRIEQAWTDPLARFTTAPDRSEPRLLLGKATTRTRVFADLRHPDQRQLQGLIQTPRVFVANSFRFGLFDQPRADQFSGPTVIALSTVRLR